MEINKREINIVLMDTDDDISVRFSLGGGEELEVERIVPDDPSGAAWIILKPKGEPDQGDWYVGRHRKQ